MSQHVQLISVGLSSPWFQRHPALIRGGPEIVSPGNELATISLIWRAV